MVLQIKTLRLNGKFVKVGLRLVRTPHEGYIVEFDSSVALMEIWKKKVVLRSAYGAWDVEVLKAVNDYIKSKI